MMEMKEKEMEQSRCIRVQSISKASFVAFCAHMGLKSVSGIGHTQSLWSPLSWNDDNNTFFLHLLIL